MKPAKKIATLTYHRSDNFGSVLQAYALSEKLRQMGFDSFIIDYCKPEVAAMYRIFQPVNSAFQLVTNAYHLLHYGALKRRQKKYEAFRQKRLRLSQVYESREALLASPPEADSFIVGSDQVWHTGIVDFDQCYLLDFVKRGRRIAYAASGIKPGISPEDLELIRRHARSFDAVSLRERDGRQRLGLGSVCIDPVLLLNREDWQALSKSTPPKKPYMLCYFAGMVSPEFEKLTRSIARTHGLERVLLMPQWRNVFRPGRRAYGTGPEEFVALLRNAALVCTDSFHGTAFSLLLNRPFLVGQALPFTDDRLATLLHAVGMADREVDPQAPALPEPLLDPDFSEVNLALAALRAHSEDWLKNAIEGDTL